MATKDGDGEQAQLNSPFLINSLLGKDIREKAGLESRYHRTRTSTAQWESSAPSRKGNSHFEPEVTRSPPLHAGGSTTTTHDVIPLYYRGDAHTGLSIFQPAFNPDHLPLGSHKHIRAVGDLRR